MAVPDRRLAALDADVAVVDGPGDGRVAPDTLDRRVADGSRVAAHYFIPPGGCTEVRMAERSRPSYISLVAENIYS